MRHQYSCYCNYPSDKINKCHNYQSYSLQFYIQNNISLNLLFNNHNQGHREMSGMIAVGLIGLAIRAGARFYRFVRTKQYIDPFRMYPGGFYSQMDRREAQLILGILPGADLATIKHRHRVLMMNNHPDNDGSTFLASKVNQAKKILINQ